MINYTQMRLYHISKLIDLHIDPGANERLRIQKVFYLLQEFGVDLGYVFGWMSGKVYSINLASDIIQVDRYRGMFTQTFHTTAITKQVIKNFTKAFEGMLYNDNLLELLSSLRFIKIHWAEYMIEETAAEHFFRHLPQFKYEVMRHTDVEIIGAFRMIETAFKQK